MREEILIVEDENGNISEPFIDYLYDSFSYEYEKNGARSISFTAYKTNTNKDVYYTIQNDNYIIYDGQYFVIKTVSMKYDNAMIQTDVTAEHIMFELQNHYIEKIEQETTDDSSEDTVSDISDDSSSTSDSSDSGDSSDANTLMTLQEYLDIGFKDNVLGYTYEIVGDFKEKQKVDGSGGKNAMEHLTSGAEYFNYIYFADNKKIYIYSQDSFYKLSDVELRYKYNTSNMDVSISSTDVKTAIKGFGKKITEKELKNYNDTKTKDMVLSGKFIKDGTWRTETVNDSFSKEFECKWGNETLIWTIKKMSKGGIIDVYVDNTKVGSYDCYSAKSKTVKTTVKKGLSKGKHTFKAIFKGAKPGVDYKKSKPCMYVGTEKAIVISTQANSNDANTYHVTSEYQSPNFNKNYPKYAPSFYSDTIVDKSELDKKLKETLQDEPTVELTVTYNDNEIINENNTVYFVHEPTGINGELKLVSLKKSLAIMNKPRELGFSNVKTDIVKIQQQIDNNIQSNIKPVGFTSSAPIYSSVIGSVLVDE